MYSGHMSLFLTIGLKLLPLVVLIVLGYAAGTLAKVEKKSVARMLLYIIVPVIVFHGVYTTTITVGAILLPVSFYVLACTLCLLAFALGKLVWKDNTANIFAYSAGTGNTGYFGIPVVLALLGPESLGPAVLATMGLIFFENTLGFFITARGSHTLKQSLIRVLTLPSLYALFLGLALNLSHVHLPAAYDTLATGFRGTYTTLGMMMIGLGISGFQKFEVDLPFLALCSVAKFIVWPLTVAGLLALDGMSTHFIDPSLHTLVLLLSLMPMAANTVVLATALKVKPEKAALGVLATTIFALIYIPAVLSFFKI